MPKTKNNRDSLKKKGKQKKKKSTKGEITLYCFYCRKPVTAKKKATAFPSTCPSCNRNTHWTETPDSNDNEDYFPKDKKAKKKKGNKEQGQQLQQEEEDTNPSNPSLDDIPSVKEIFKKDQGFIIHDDGVPEVTRIPIQIFVKQFLYESSVLVNTAGAYSKKSDLCLYMVEWAKGKSPKFIIAHYTNMLKEGHEIDIYLKPVDSDYIPRIFGLNGERSRDQNALIKKLSGKNILNIKTNKPESSNPKKMTDLTMQEVLDKILSMHEYEPLFFTPTQAVSRKEILNIPDIDGMIRKALSGGYNKDPRIIEYARSAGIPQVVNDTRRTPPNIIMKSAPHSIIITPSKVAKTATFRKVGPILDRPSTAGLLGFSTAQGEPTRGRLHGETRLAILDGLEETPMDEQVASGLMNMLESGIVEITRGKGVTLETYSTVAFVSNPSIRTDSDKEYDWFDDLSGQVMQFNQILEIMHQNQMGMGSRIGVLFYNPDMEPVSGEGLPSLVEESYDKLIQSIQELTRYPFTLLIHKRQVGEWLHKVCKKIVDYQEKVMKMAGESQIKKYRLISDFVKGHTNSRVHLKGMALRMAFMDNIEDMISIEQGENLSDTLTDMILRDAENNLDTVIGWNLESLSNISTAFEEHDYRDILNRGRLSNLEARGSQYEMMLLDMSAEWYLKQPEDNMKPIIALAELKPYYLSCFSRDEREKTRYNAFNKFLEVVEKNIDKINRHTRWHGLQLKKTEGVTHILFTNNPEWYEWVRKREAYTSPRPAPLRPVCPAPLNESAGQTGQMGAGHGTEQGDKIDEIALFEETMATKKTHDLHYIELAKAVGSDNPEYIHGRLIEITSDPNNTSKIRMSDTSGEYFRLYGGET